MTFYSTISRYYEEIFPGGEGSYTRLMSLMEGKSALLDAGCGTGELVRRLRTGKVDARGFDLDGEMIRLAGSYLPGAEDVFSVGDLTYPDKVFPGVRFDLISCLGNTLVHIPSEGVKGFIKGASFILKPGGKLVIQTLNYRNILEKGMTLPPIETEHCLFKRSYRRDADPGLLHFETELTNRESGEVFTHSTRHYPLSQDQIRTLLEEGGFSECAFYGSWKGEAPSDSQLPLIIEASQPC